MMLLPCRTRKSVFTKWISFIRKYINEPGKLTTIQRLHLKSLLNEVVKRAKKKVYPAGMYTDSGVPASKGRRVKLMPFGTWYYKPTRRVKK
jgi:hypothetical protein